MSREAIGVASRYLSAADLLLPRRITGFWLVGSAALGGWRPRRSDTDFIAATDGPLDARDLRRLRALHLAGNAFPAGSALLHARPTVPGTVNGAYVSADDLARPVTTIRPLASHVGTAFRPGYGSDVNPVVWKVLAERAITLRGPAPYLLDLDPEPSRLRPWTLANLREHWGSWARRALNGKPPPAPLLRAEITTGTLGPLRLHRTVATGEVVTKETAGRHGLDLFPPHRQALIHAALAHRDGATPPASPRLLRLTGEFALEVIADAERIAARDGIG
ncbi:hypothetical protein [Streptomyces avicenniae]|uniref:hypothetical protein n=1 Tax=Streptomyces avicenniae TaxID=500153 RepID=UPI00069C5813|nr:hypothetical protein [Streptomyces avicenniae]